MRQKNSAAVCRAESKETILRKIPVLVPEKHLEMITYFMGMAVKVR